VKGNSAGQAGADVALKGLEDEQRKFVNGKSHPNKGKLL
jgi:hypothetical protein